MDDGLKRPSQLGIAIDKALEDILMKGLALKASDRYQSADEMLSAIDAALSSKMHIPDQPQNKKTSKIKRPIAAICSVLAAALIIAVFFLRLNNSSIVYDPESMYKVTLTPTDEFTVAGYNESIKTLEERLKLLL